MDVLASSIAKLRSTIRLTEELSVGDFPHKHAKEALLHIGRIFRTGLQQLESLNPATDAAVVRALAAAQSKKIFQLFPLLGFLLRSTDVRNSFEIHGPFLRIVRQLLGPGSKLVISSEWDFSPFTFLPPTEYGLTDTVLIGGPASESSNVLVIPLAGHELGHNVWAKQKRREQLGPELWEEIRSYIASTRWSEFQSHFPLITKPAELSDLLGTNTWAPAWNWAIRQCEEIFCDFIGLSLFRESFLHATSYLLAPGLPTRRNHDYPASQQRANYHVQAAAQWGIAVPDDYMNRFDNEQFPTQQPLKMLLELADFGTSRLAEKLMVEAETVVRNSGVTHASHAEIEKIGRCFAQCVPTQNAPNLPAIINAAWSYYLSGMNEWKAMYPELAGSPQRLLELLSDLVLKQSEVFEIEQRQANAAA
jgi:hypothetical protein